MRFKHLFLAVVTTAVAAESPLQAQRTTGTLAERMNRLLDEPPFDRGLWGVAIADPRGRIVYERNSGRLFVPASSTKVIVSAAALWMLPEDYRFRTTVYAAGPVRDGVLEGDLVLYGRGDPTLSRRFARGGPGPLEQLAESLAIRGITRITGDVVGDASWFDSNTTHSDWESGDLAWSFAAPVAALGYNDNAVQVRVTPTQPGSPPTIDVFPEFGGLMLANRARTVSRDSSRRFDFRRLVGTNIIQADGDVPADTRPRTESLAVPDGALYAAEAFRRRLEARGISVGGRVRSHYDPYTSASLTAAVLAERRSPPIDSIIVPILESSNNWYAEMLLKTLGREILGRGTWEAGLEVERAWLRDSLRIDTSMVYLSDASGLSHHDLVAPRAFLTILQRMKNHRRWDAFRNALPESGERGTLRSRFRRGALAGRVRAKTGSIGNVNTLNGYIEDADGSVWTFSIQINNHAGRSRDAIDRIDAVVAAIPR